MYLIKFTYLNKIFLSEFLSNAKDWSWLKIFTNYLKFQINTFYFNDFFPDIFSLHLTSRDYRYRIQRIGTSGNIKLISVDENGKNG